MTVILFYLIEVIQSSVRSQFRPRNVHGSGLAFTTADVPARSSMSMLPHILSVRMYDAGDHQVVS